MDSCTCGGLGLCPVCDWNGFRDGPTKRGPGPRQIVREEDEPEALEEETEDESEESILGAGLRDGWLRFFLALVAEYGDTSRREFHNPMATKTTAKKTTAKKAKSSAMGLKKKSAAKK